MTNIGLILDDQKHLINLDNICEVTLDKTNFVDFYFIDGAYLSLKMSPEEGERLFNYLLMVTNSNFLFRAKETKVFVRGGKLK